MSDQQLKIAIIGSGPSGCFTAQFLRKKWKQAEITIFEALPAPFGLVRYGVAPDHQGMKSVTAQFDRLFEKGKVNFIGNVKVGTSVSINDIKAHFDVVVRATGLRNDKCLSIPGSQEHKILGAGEIIRALNGHPETALTLDASGNLLPLGKRIALIGNGNVAMDVIRLLCKPLEEFDGSDVADERLLALRQDGIEQIDVLGRSPIGAAKFDLSMFKEILSLPNISVTANGICAGDECAATDLLQCANNSAEGKTTTVNFDFGCSPLSIHKEGDSLVLSIARKDNASEFTIKADSIITAIGFTDEEAQKLNAQWADEHVFKVGWLNRNGKGTVAENRKDAKAVADEIVGYIEQRDTTAEKCGLKAIMPIIKETLVTYQGWKSIDQFERDNCPGNRCRTKITCTDQMLEIAKAAEFASALITE